MKKILLSIFFTILFLELASATYYTDDGHNQIYIINITNNNVENGKTMAINLSLDGTDCINDPQDTVVCYKNCSSGKKPFNFTNTLHNRIIFIADDVEIASTTTNKDYSLYCNTSLTVTNKGAFNYTADFDDNDLSGWKTSIYDVTNPYVSVLKNFSSPYSLAFNTGSPAFALINLSNFSKSISIDYSLAPDEGGAEHCAIAVSNYLKPIYETMLKLYLVDSNNVRIYNSFTNTYNLTGNNSIRLGNYSHFNINMNLVNNNSNVTLGNNNKTNIPSNGSVINQLRIESAAYSFICYIDNLFISENNFMSYANTSTSLSAPILHNSSFIQECKDGTEPFDTITIYDEDLPSSYLNATAEIEATSWLTSRSNSQKYYVDLTGNYSYTLCKDSSTNATMYYDLYVKYTTENGYTNRFYATNNSYSGIKNTDSLYNFNTTTGHSTLKITVRDTQTYAYLKNIIGRLQRRYSGEGVWRTVQMDKSADYGLLTYNIMESSNDYRLIFTDSDGRILKTTDSMKFICSSGLCDLTYLLDMTLATSVNKNLQYTVYFNNATKNISVKWNDSLSTVTSLRLQVIKQYPSRFVSICDQTQTGAAGEMGCNVSAYTGDIMVSLYSTASPEVPEWTDYITLTRDTIKSKIGLAESSWWAGVIALIIAGTGMFSPVGVVISSVIGLMVVYMMGLGTISISFVIAGIIIGLVVALKVKN